MPDPLSKYTSSGGTSAPKSNDPLSKYSGGGGGGTAQPKAQTSQVPQTDLFRLAARLNSAQVRNNPSVQAEVRRQTANALKGFTWQQIKQFGQKAGLNEDDVLVLGGASGAAKAESGGMASPYGAITDVLNRPEQAVAGGLTEGSGLTPSFSGAVKGLTGAKQYDPAQSILQSVGGQNARQAKATLAGLPAPVRIIAETGAGIVTDPLTALSAGTTAEAEAAARTAAPIIAEQRGLIDAAEAGRVAETGAINSNEHVANIFQDLHDNGVKNLSRDERAALKDIKTPGARIGGVQVTPDRAQLYGNLKDAQGGVRVAGLTLPGTPEIQHAATSGVSTVLSHLPAKARETLAQTEGVARTVGQLRAAQRGGDVAPGTVTDVQNALSRLEGAPLVGDLHNAELLGAQRTLEKAVGTDGLGDALAHVQKAATVGGNPADLTEPERAFYETWNRQRLANTQTLTDKGALIGPDEATARMQQDILDKEAPKLSAYERVAQRRAAESDRAQAQLGELRNLAARLPAGPARQEVFAHISSMANDAEKLKTAAETAAERLQQDKELALAKAHGARALNPEERFPRYLTPEGRAEAEVKGGTGSAGGVPGTVKAREADTRFTPETELTTESGAPRFELNPTLAGARDNAATARLAGRTEFFDTISKINGPGGKPLGLAEGMPGFEEAAADVAKNRAKSDYREVAFPVEDANGRLTTQTTYVHKVIADDVTKVSKLYTDTAAQATWKRMTDYAERIWKANALTSTGFLVKKTEGEMLAFYMLGASPKSLGPAAAMVQRVGKGLAEGDAFKYLNEADKATYLRAVKSRALWSGFEKVDLGGTSDELLKQLEDHGWGTRAKNAANSVNPLSTKFLPYRGTKAVANYVSNSARLGLFISLERKGYSAAEAGRLVRKYLFDYADLSRADEAIKHVSPFFTWTRKNVPLQLETLLKQPGKITAQLHLLNAVNSAAGPHDPFAVPSYITEGGGFVTPSGKQAVALNIPLTSAYEPVEALAGLPNLIPGIHKVLPQYGGPGAFTKELGIGYNALGVGGPLVGTGAGALQAITGRQAFSGIPFKPGADVPTPTWLGGKNSPVGPYIPSEMQYLLNNVIPSTTKLQGLFPNTGGKPLTTKQKQVAGEKLGAKIASLLSGATVAPVNDSARSTNLYGRVDQLNAVVNWLKSRGIKVPTYQEITKGR